MSQCACKTKKHSSRMRTARFCGSTGYGPRKDIVRVQSRWGYSPVGVWSREGMVPGDTVPRGMILGLWSKGSMVTGGYGARRVWS